jgi:hypothetical protein
MQRKIISLALMLMVGLIFLTGCKDDPGDGNNNNGNNNNNNGNGDNNNNTTTSSYSISGDNLTFSGQVYKIDLVGEAEEFIITKVNDSFDVYIPYHGEPYFNHEAKGNIKKWTA